MKKQSAHQEEYGYFLPNDRDIDEFGIYEAMSDGDAASVWFLDLASGDVVDICLPRDQELYENMKREIFAYAEIPKFGPGKSESELSIELLRFIHDLPVRVERDLAEPIKPDEDCGCPMCELELLCEREDRSPTTDEIRDAMRRSRDIGGVVGGFDDI